MPRALHIETVTHGLVLVRDATTTPVRGAIVAFHGYAQSAEIMLGEIEGTDGIDAWTVVSVQGLHRFYTRGDAAVIASWMTRQDRHVAIADNVAYVARAIETAVPADQRVILLGYSQGAAMAYRAAAASTRPIAAVVAIGGDVPSDVDVRRLPRTFIGVGEKDHWYTPDKVKIDLGKLASAGVSQEVRTWPTGHEWSDECRRAIHDWLEVV